MYLYYLDTKCIQYNYNYQENILEFISEMDINFENITAVDTGRLRVFGENTGNPNPLKYLSPESDTLYFRLTFTNKKNYCTKCEKGKGLIPWSNYLPIEVYYSQKQNKPLFMTVTSGDNIMIEYKYMERNPIIDSVELISLLNNEQYRINPWLIEGAKRRHYFK